MPDPVRHAACSCGAVTVTCAGALARVSACHCLDCQRRSGSAFAAQARWPDDRVSVSGETRPWTRVGDEGSSCTFHFCPTCGATMWYVLDSMPGVTAVPVGAFAEPGFPTPGFSVYENRRQPWAAIIGDAVVRD